MCCSTIHGKPRDVMTLAHELGHGVHQVLAAPNGALMAPTPLTLAETASVFGEMLTFRAMLAKATRPGGAQARCSPRKVEDMLNTVVRQIAFYTFERAVHLERRNGELTAERIGELWMQRAERKPRPGDRTAAGLRDLLGLYPPLHPLALLRLRLRLRRLPRELALRRLRARRTRASPSAISPCSRPAARSHSELLAPFGLDAKDPASGASGFRVIEGMINELEAMG